MGNVDDVDYGDWSCDICRKFEKNVRFPFLNCHFCRKDYWFHGACMTAMPDLNYNYFTSCYSCFYGSL